MFTDIYIEREKKVRRIVRMFHGVAIRKRKIKRGDWQILLVSFRNPDFECDRIIFNIVNSSVRKDGDHET